MRIDQRSRWAKKMANLITGVDQVPWHVAKKIHYAYDVFLRCKWRDRIPQVRWPETLTIQDVDANKWRCTTAQLAERIPQVAFIRWVLPQIQKTISLFGRFSFDLMEFPMSEYDMLIQAVEEIVASEEAKDLSQLSVRIKICPQSTIFDETDWPFRISCQDPISTLRLILKLPHVDWHLRWAD
eukprot:TRINITY_DN3787_c0_g1_i3.p1 TRINITY_DN3787_c0_g1~~TRINITY_DN3787_c0_g1_i3.p1  ORF type:complete len:183 (+),score=12.16 TRINITY_DN3787_c0_g1_i3:312-860(+)